MSCEQITPEEADRNMESAVSRHLHRMSSVYKSGITGMEKLSQKSEHTIGRLTGVTYKIKTLEALVKGCQKTSVSAINEILHDDKLTFLQKANSVRKHIGQSFSRESLVAGSILATKVAIGTALMTASAAPAATMVSGYMVYKCVKSPIEYYLSTHAGHGFEAGIAQKGIKGIMKDIRSILHGKKPEFEAMHELSEKLDHIVHGHSHGHAHGHHHHEKISDTLKKDLHNIKSSFLHPIDTLTKVIKGVGNDCVDLYRHMKGRKESGPELAAAKEEPVLPREQKVRADKHMRLGH
jgi:hypothetical protein